MIRKQTLNEWFTTYQLRSIGRQHFHLPVLQDVDVTSIAAHYIGQSVPWTTVCIQVFSAAARAYSPLNRMVFHTPFGMRVVEPSYIALNIPVLLRGVDPEYLSATTLENADQKTIHQLHSEIRTAASRKPSDLPIGKLIIGKPNTFLNRLRLRVVHAIVYASPRAFLKYRAGALSFSSLFMFHRPGLSVRPVSYGPTGVTLCGMSVVQTPEGKSILKLGVGVDHYALSGAEGARALSEIARQFELWRPEISDPPGKTSTLL